MPAPYLRDRDRVELAIASAMLYELAGSCIAYRMEMDPNRTPEEEAIDNALQDALRVAAWEPFEGLYGKDNAKLARRVLRAKEAAIGEYREVRHPHTNEVIRKGADMMKVFQMVRFWVAHLVKTDYLVIYDGTAFAEAWDLLAAEIETEEHKERLDDVEASAWKQARKMHGRLQAAGYFTDAKWEG